MTNRQLLHYCDRIQFWSAMCQDLQSAYTEALDTIMRTDSDIYRDVTQRIADHRDKTLQFCATRLRTAKNDFKQSLIQEDLTGFEESFHQDPCDDDPRDDDEDEDLPEGYFETDYTDEQ
jgi:hypothetical protein